MVNSSDFNSAEISICIPTQSLEIWCGCGRLTYKASSAVLSPNNFTKASSFCPCFYSSWFSSLWHHWHTVLASLPCTFFLLSFLDNAFLYSTPNCCFIQLIYLGEIWAAIMLKQPIGNPELCSVIYKFTRRRSAGKAIAISVVLVKASGPWQGGLPLLCDCRWCSLHLVPGEKKSTILTGKFSGKMRIGRFGTGRGYGSIY